MIYKIIKFANPVLRQKGTLVTEFKDELKELAADMVETMHDAEGIGLAAQQIGKAIRLCVIDIPERVDKDEVSVPLHPDVTMPLVLVNPEVMAQSEEREPYEEGCLSFPEITGNVVRPVEVTVRFQDVSGAKQEVGARGMLARCMQHEIDHLNGVLYIDRMSNVKRVALAGKLKRLKKQTELES
ncbi:MAG: peptide deformylase [Verrucomicrobiota bacterium]|jgi:peptide deformylase